MKNNSIDAGFCYYQSFGFLLAFRIGYSTSLPSTVLNFKEESKGYKYFVVKIATLFVNYSQKEVSLHFLLRIDEYFDGDHLPTATVDLIV